MDETLPAQFADDAPDWVEELDDMLATGEVEILELPPAAPREWSILTQSQAESIMRRLAELVSRKRDVVAQAAAWHAPIDEWERDALARINPGIAFWEGHLERYGIWYREQHPKEKTVYVPSGEIGTKRPKGPAVIVADEVAVLAWAEANLTANEYQATVKLDPKLKVREFKALTVIREVDVPFCLTCGAAIADEGEWQHDADGEYDHPATPALDLQVVIPLVRTESDPVEYRVVPGVTVEPPETTAVVRPKV